MSIDAKRVVELLPWLPYVWGAAVQLVVVLVLLLFQARSMPSPRPRRDLA